MDSREDCPHRWVESEGERVCCSRCRTPMRHDPLTGAYRVDEEYAALRQRIAELEGIRVTGDRLDEYARRAATDPGMGWAREAVRELVAEVRRTGGGDTLAARYDAAREAYRQTLLGYISDSHGDLEAVQRTAEEHHAAREAYFATLTPRQLRLERIAAAAQDYCDSLDREEYVGDGNIGPLFGALEAPR